MSEFKKLFQAKRILAMILAVAMVVTMLPTTTYAASVTDSVPVQSEETDTSDVPDTEESADAAAEETAAGETIPAETTEVTAETETTIEAEEAAPTQTGEAQPTADGEASDVIQTEIIIDEEQLYYEAVYMNMCDYDSTARKVVAEYDETSENRFDGLLSAIKRDVVSLAGDNMDAMKDHLIYKWQAKGADGSWTDMAAADAPVNVGEYKLVISMDAALAAAEPKEIGFEIEKKTLTVITNGFTNVKKSGITVKEVKEELDKAIALQGVGDYKAYVKAVTINVRETLGTEALADETVLKKGNDYSVDVIAELADEFKANFELKQLAVVNLKINELKDTVLTITNNLISQEKDITRTYTGEAAAEPTTTGDAPEITVEVTVAGEKDETTGEDKVLPVEYAALTKTWLDADGAELESAPVNAGTYYFELKYTDAEGIYGESSAAVKVVVEPAKLVLKPELAVTDYFVGMTAKDVTVNATYSLFTADGKAFDFDKETFWGVSYNNQSSPQSYAPVFKLQMGQTETAADGQLNTTWTDVKGVIEEPAGVKEIETKAGEKKEVTISYRVVFKGTKALFNNGAAFDELDVNETDVNSAEKNYVVDTAADVVEANAAAVNVSANANATIDVTAMLINGMNEEKITKDDETYSIYSRVYNGLSLYENRAAYKKAVVKDNDGKDIAKDTADSIAYNWYRYEMQTVIDKEGKAVEIPVITEEKYTWYDENAVNAGMYVLEVRYTDAEHRYTAKPAYIYFRIDKQLLKLIPEGTPETYAGTYVWDFTYYQTKDMNYKIYKIPNNDLTLTNDKLEEMPELAKDGIVTIPGVGDVQANPYVYRLQWFVKAGDDTDASKAEFTEYQGEFKLGVPYKLGAKIEFTGKYADAYKGENYTDNYEVVVEEETKTEYTSELVPITVKKMGETELELNVDSSKLTTDEKVYDGQEFDISADIAKGFITVNKKNTDEMIPITGEGAITLNYRWEYTVYDEDGDEYYRSTTQPIDAYEYTLYVSFAGDDNYQATGEAEVGTFTILPRELTVTPVLHETITAGLHMNDGEDRAQVIDDTKAEITGYIDEDAAAFTYRNSIKDAAAFSYTDEAGNTKTIIESVVEDQYGNDNSTILRTGKEYTASYTFNRSMNAKSLKDQYAGNYTVRVTPVKFQTNKRGHSTVWSTWHATDECYIPFTRLRAEYNDTAIRIVPMEGIPYSFSAVEDEKGNILEGNYFVFEIEKPDEFYAYSYSINKDAVYKNSIEKAGGYVLYEGRNDISVAFDAAAPESGDNIRTFDICWEDGYVEQFTVDFTNAELEDDLTSAVEPKKLAFNGVNGKMIVGEGQQLDVKITKHLINDIICLNYEVVAGEDVVSVNRETGYATALKKGTATVAVYPVRYDREGNAAKLDFKAVTTKITVSDVTAPKIAKVSAYDDTMEVQYTKPSDGYRREIYVLEGKNVKAADFEEKLAAANQGVFDGIQIAYVNERNRVGVSSYDEKKNQVTYKITGLKPNTDYTVYVRNVSGIRTLADDSLVVSSAAGSVKSFKTTKPQVEWLSLYFDEEQPVTYNKEQHREEVKLSEKSIKITAEGFFGYKAENEAADTTDGVWYDLPLSKELQKTYVNPKLSFFVLEDGYGHDEKTDYYTQLIGDKYYAPTSIAKVDKNGKITLNGVGWVYVYAYDSISKELSDSYCFYVDAGVDKITAKNMKAKVGEPQYIGNSLTFYDGKTKLKFSGVMPALKAEIVSGTGIELNGLEVTATQAQQNAEIKVTLVENPEVSATVKVSTQAMTPVKGLKADNIMDTSFGITFTHSMSIYDSGAYKIEIRDGRNRLVRSELVTYDTYDLELDWKKSNAAKRSYVYHYDIDDLVRKSSYRISVTPVYGAETAKAAAIKVNTTDLPAYHGSLKEKNQIGGMNIYRSSINHYNEGNIEWHSINEGYFTSGNSYTFIADAETYADQRATDTLTWKSTDTKVATIKANPGTYMATFKALKPGVTTIEVSSKLRKGVIARYIVRVKAVGMSTDRESGDFELDFDPYYTQDVLALTEHNPVKVQSANGAYEYRWVKFTAPEYGDYYFDVSDGTIEKVEYAGNNQDDWDGWDSNYHYATLAEGETIYFKVNGSFTMTVSGEKYAKLTTTTSVNANESRKLVFTAPEDNFYTFEATKADRDAEIYVNGAYERWGSLYNKDNESSRIANVALNKGDVVTLLLDDAGNYDVSVSYRKAAPLTAEGVSVNDLTKENVKWYTFTAAASGNYTFQSTEATDTILAEFYETIMEPNGTKLLQGTVGEGEGAVDNSKNFLDTKWIEKGTTVAIKVYTESAEAVSAKIAVTVPVTAEIASDEAKEVTVAKNGESWVAFTADEDGAKYTFTVTGDAVTNGSVAVSYKTKSGSRAADRKTFSSTLNKGDKVYIQLMNSAAEDVKVNVAVTKAKAVEMKAGEAKDLTVENGGVYFYTFTAPSTGLYVFQSEVTENAEGTDTHRLAADRYTSVSDSYPQYSGWCSTNSYRTNDFYGEHTLLAGTKVVFAVRAVNDAVTAEGKAAVTKAKISVTKATPSDLPTGEILLAKDSKGEAQWYQFKAAADDYYAVNADVRAGSVVVYYGTSLDEMHPLSSSTQKMNAGNTLYFKVVNTGAEEAKVALTVGGVKSSAEDIPDKAFEAENGKEKIYKYTAKSAGRYVVNFKSDPAGAAEVRQVYYGNGSYYDYGNAPISNGAEVLCQNAGETIYLKVTANAAEGNKATVSLSVNPVKVTALESELTVKVQPNEPQWFAYTVPATGRYTFAAATGENNAEDYSGSVKYYSSMASDYSYRTMADVAEIWQKKGTVLYFKVPNDTDAEISVQLTAKEIKAEEITAGTKEVALKKGEAQWFKFTASEDTYYTITNEPADGMGVSAYYYKNASSYYESLFAGTVRSISLDKGDTLLIKLSRYDSAETESFTTKLTIRQEELLKLEEGKDLTITTKNGGRQYISFTPSRTGNYAFGVKEVPKDVTVTSSGAVSDLDSYYCVEWCEIAEEVRFNVGAQFAAETEDATKSYKLYVERVNPTELEFGKAVEVTAAKYQKVWFTFEAPEEGIYRLTTDNTVQDMKYVKMFSYSEASMPAEYPMSKGSKVAIGVSYEANKDASEAPDSASFQVKAEKLTPQAIQDGKATVELEAGASAWLSYTAAKGCEYDIQCSGADYETYAFDQDGEWYSPAILPKDGMVYIKVTNYGSEKSSVTVEVTSREFETLSTDQAVPVEITAEDISAGKGYKWLAFTAPSTGEYAFYSTSVETSSYQDSYAELYNSNMGLVTEDDDSSDGLNFRMTQIVAKDQTVYLRVKGNNMNSSIAFNVHAEYVKPVETITLGTAKVAELDEEDYVFYQFTAPTAGVYAFYSTSVEDSSNQDSYGVLYDKYMEWLDDDDDGNGYPNFRIVHAMNAGETVFLKVREVSYTAITCNVHVDKLN